MAHYAFLDENNIVTEVIVGIDETELIEGLNPEIWYSNFRGQVCKRTSYNAINGKWKNPETNEITDNPGFRKNYAGIGMKYDENLDAFIYPQPYPSWVLNLNNYQWEAPVPYPVVEEDSDEKYIWDENSTSWLLLPPPN